MTQIIWTKIALAEAINCRIDKLPGVNNDYILANEITDEDLEGFQEVWNDNSAFPVNREQEYGAVYQKIIARF